MQHIMIKRQEKTICIIPARKNSKRIKNKNLLKIKGETLIDICIKLSIKSNLFEKIILSSDSNKILNIGKKYKILTIKRGKKFQKINPPLIVLLEMWLVKLSLNFKI